MLQEVTARESYLFTQGELSLFRCKKIIGRYKHWTGLLDWTTAMAFSVFNFIFYILLYWVVSNHWTGILEWTTGLTFLLGLHVLRMG